MERGDIVQLGRHRLMCGPAEDFLNTASVPQVDAIVTDPPFGIGFKYSEHNDTAKGYGIWLWSVIQRAEQHAAPGSPVFVWQAMPNIREAAEWFPRDWRIFAAGKNFVQMRKSIAMQYSFDPVLVWWIEGERWTAGTANRDFHLADTNPSTRRKGSAGHVEGHPCPRPLGQIEHVLAQWVRPGGTVLDPFSGSGTTLIAAERTGRAAVCIEIDPGYCQVSIDRYSKLTAQPVIVGS